MLGEVKEPPGSHHKPAAGPAPLPRELKLAPSYRAGGGPALGFDQSSHGGIAVNIPCQGTAILPSIAWEPPPAPGEHPKAQLCSDPQDKHPLLPAGDSFGICTNSWEQLE